MKLLKVDNTKRNTAATCMRKFYYTFVKNIQPDKGSTALRYGSVWHECMNAYYSFVAENGWKAQSKGIQLALLVAESEWNAYSCNSHGEPTQTFYEDYRSLANLYQSLAQYFNFFQNDQGMIEILASENPFEISIIPTDKELSLYSYLEPFVFSGIIDLEVTLNGMPWITDHKTTGQSISIQLDRLNRSAQFIGYNWAAEQWLPIKPEGSLIIMHHLSAYKSRTTGNYGTPKIDFKRCPQIYTQNDFVEWRNSLMKTTNAIYQAYKTDNWPMEFDNCYQFGECRYTPLCMQQCKFGKWSLNGYHIGEEWDVAALHLDQIKRRKPLLDIIYGTASKAKGVL